MTYPYLHGRDIFGFYTHSTEQKILKPKKKEKKMARETIASLKAQLKEKDDTLNLVKKGLGQIETDQICTDGKKIYNELLDKLNITETLEVHINFNCDIPKKLNLTDKSDIDIIIIYKGREIYNQTTQPNDVYEN